MKGQFLEGFSETVLIFTDRYQKGGNVNQTWDTEKYAAEFSFVYEYGNDLLKLIDLTDEHGRRGIDLGCGNGVLTKSLADLGFEMTGMDASSHQISAAQHNYPQLNFIQTDATDFKTEEPVDLIFSNAVFHWIDRDKQPDMLKCVANALRYKGQFVFEMGGYGNNRLIHQELEQVFSEYGYPYKMPFYFPTIGEYASLLEKAGLEVRYATLFDRPTPLKGHKGLEEWIRMFVNNPFRQVSEKDREAIIRRTAENLRSRLYKDGIWYSDYVRLRMKALKRK